MANAERRWDLIVLSLVGAIAAATAGLLAVTGHQNWWGLGNVVFYLPVWAFGLTAATSLATRLIVEKIWPASTSGARWGWAVSIWCGLMLVIFLFVVRYPVTPGIAYDQSLVSYEERGIKLRFNSSTPRQPLTEYQQDGYIGFFGSIRRFQIFPVKSALGCGYEHLPERCAWVECEVEYRFKVAGLHFYRQPPLESPVSEADARRCRSLSYADVQTSGERHRIERWP